MKIGVGLLFMYVSMRKLWDVNLLRYSQQLYKRQQREQGGRARDVVLELRVRLVAVLTLLTTALEPESHAVHAFGVCTGNNRKYGSFLTLINMIVKMDTRRDGKVDQADEGSTDIFERMID